MPVSIPADGARGRFLLWISHRAAWMWTGAAIVDLLASVIHGNIPRLVAVVALLGVMFLTHANHYHGLALCPLCAAATPLDGPQTAQDRAATLRQAHRVYSVAYGVVEVVLGVAAIVAMVVLSMTPGTPNLITAIPVDVLFGIAAIEAYVLSVHRPLQPWCPQCHWDDGGHEEHVPDPVPPSGAVQTT
jgi:hypothetical protein